MIHPETLLSELTLSDLNEIYSDYHLNFNLVYYDHWEINVAGICFFEANIYLEGTTWNKFMERCWPIYEEKDLC